MRRAQAQEPAKIWIAENGAIRVRSPWQATFVHYLKQFPAAKRRWMPEMKVWEVEYELLDELVALARQYFPDVIVVEREQRKTIESNGKASSWDSLLTLLTKDDLTALYKVLAKRYHPDLNKNSGDAMSRINN